MWLPEASGQLKHKLEEVTLDYNRKDQQVPSAFSMSHLEGIWDNALGTFLTFSDPSPSIDVDAYSNRYFLGLWGFASLWWGRNRILRAAALVSSLWELFLLLFCSRFLDLGSVHHISPSWSQGWRKFWTCEPLGPWGPRGPPGPLGIPGEDGKR